MSNFYANQAWMYASVLNYKKAKKYFSLALKDSTKIKAKIYIIAAHHGLGYTYQKLREYQKAIYHDTIALHYFEKVGNKSFQGVLCNNLANVYIEKKEYNKALVYAKNALIIAKKTTMNNHVIAARLTLGKLYLSMGNTEKTLTEIADLLPNNMLFPKTTWKQKVKLYTILAGIASKTKDFKDAYHYQELAKTYNDSVSKRSIANFSDFELEYSNQKKTKELALNTGNLLAQKRQKTYLAIGMALVIIVLALVLFISYIRLKKQKVAQQKQLANIKALKEELKILMTPKELIDLDDNFHSFLKDKYKIEKDELIRVWDALAKGLTRSEYAKEQRISENTIKSWRNQLYTCLKRNTQYTGRYSDAQAIITYYNSLMEFKSLLKK